jgi:hypothetical protein
MTMQIIIGRGGNDDPFNLAVPEHFSMVSRKHAIVEFTENEIVFEDSSSNGSWVNGVPVRKKVVKDEDIIMLGDKDNGFKLDLNVLKQKVESHKNKNRIDFSPEFEVLKKTYSNYNNASNQIKKKYKSKTSLPQILFSIAGMIIFFALGQVFDIPPQIGMFFYIAVPTVAVFLFSLKQDSNAMQRELLLTKHNLAKEYVCPKCRKPLNIDLPIEILEQEKTCPHKCGAIYKP